LIDIYGFIPTAPRLTDYNGVYVLARRYMLSKKEKKKLIGEISGKFPGIMVSRDSSVEVYEDRDLGGIYIIDGIPALIRTRDGLLIPHLKYLLSKGYDWLPYVVVDMGAVKPLLRGADLMVPGIRNINGIFDVGDIVVVVDEKYKKPFVVGKALIPSRDITSRVVKRGKALENLHRVGDEYWRIT
jgi:PUA-domain protein